MRYTSDFDKYQSGYVPTTILVDRNGNIIDTGVSYEGIDSTLIVGSKSYQEWADLIEDLLPEGALRIHIDYGRGEDERIFECSF